MRPRPRQLHSCPSPEGEGSAMPERANYSHRPASLRILACLSNTTSLSHPAWNLEPPGPAGCQEPGPSSSHSTQPCWHFRLFHPAESKSGQFDCGQNLCWRTGPDHRPKSPQDPIQGSQNLKAFGKSAPQAEEENRGSTSRNRVVTPSAPQCAVPTTTTFWDLEPGRSAQTQLRPWSRKLGSSTHLTWNFSKK